MEGSLSSMSITEADKSYATANDDSEEVKEDRTGLFHLIIPIAEVGSFTD